MMALLMVWFLSNKVYYFIHLFVKLSHIPLIKQFPFLCIMSATNYSYQQLSDFTASVFLKIGCSQQHALSATKALLSADLRGVDSHGIARLSGYVRLWEAKRVNGECAAGDQDHS
jgi:hypothetical protein